MAFQGSDQILVQRSSASYKSTIGDLLAHISSSGVGATVTTADSPPDGASFEGDMWWNTTNGSLYIYYNDGDSTQWVPAFSVASADGSDSPVQSVNGLNGNVILTTDNIIEGTLKYSRWDESAGDLFYTAGNVGIGTSSPLMPLSIEDVSGDPDLTFNGNGALSIGDSTTQMVGGRTSTGSVYLQGRNSGNAAANITFNPVGGNVGIGTTTPSGALSVQPTQGSTTVINFVAGTTNSDAVRLSAAGNTNNWFEYDAYLGHNFLVNGSPVLTFDAAGAMAIGGAVPSEYANASNNLTIKDASNAGLTIHSGTTDLGTVAFTNTNDGNNDGWVQYNHAVSQMKIGANSSDVIIIDSNNDVGIGGTPSIDGKVVVTGTSKQLALQTSNLVDGNLTIGHTAAGTLISVNATDGNAGDNIRFATHTGDERMRVHSNGFVGINNQTPTTELDVTGTVTATTFIGNGSGLTGVGGNAHTGPNPPSSPGDGDIWYSNTDGRLYIYYQDVDSSQWVDASPNNFAERDFVKTNDEGTTQSITGGGGLDVVGSADFSGSVISGSLTDDSLGCVALRQNIGSDPNRPQFLIKGDAGTNNVFQINEGGIQGADIRASITNAGSAYFAGNVGIGTTSPDQLLHLESGAPRMRLIDSDVSTGGQVSGSSGNLSLTYDVLGVGGKNFSIADSTSTRLLIDSSGNVGIGLSSASSHDPNANNLVVGSGSGSNGITIRTSTTGEGMLAFADGTTGDTQRKNGFIAHDHSVNSLRFGTGASERMRIDSSGRVGIGETSMDALLVIKGNSDASTTPSIRLKDGTDIREAWITNASGDLSLNVGGDDNVAHATLKMFESGIFDYAQSTGSVLRVDSSGRVGVSRTSPFSQIHAYHATDNTILTLESGDSVSRINFIDSAGQAFIGNEGNNIVLATSSSATERMRIESDGDFQLGGSTNYAFIRPWEATTGNLIIGADQSATGTGGSATIFRNRGSESMRIDSSGNVGIGTTSPSSNLEVVKDGTYSVITASSNITTTGLASRFTLGNSVGNARFTINMKGGGGEEAYLGSEGNFPIYFQTNGTERMRIDSSGRLLVGTSSAFRADAFVQIKGGNGTSAASLALASTNNNPTSGTDLASITISDTGGNRGAQITATADGNWTSGSSNPTLLSLSTTASGASSPTERMRIDSSGRLLVGTSSSRAMYGSVNNKFQIEGGSHASSSLSLTRTGGSAPQINLASSANTSFGLVSNGGDLGVIAFLGADGSAMRSAALIKAEVDGTPGTNDMPGRLVFSTTADGASSPTERMRINNLGNTLIYSTNTTSLASKSNAVAGSTYSLFVGSHSATSTLDGTVSFNVTTNGNVTNTNNSYGAISDITLKENIVPASDQWDNIKNIEVVNYNFKEETGHETHKQLGVIAQQVEEVSPGLVKTDEEGLKSVNYSVLYMKSIKALQEAMDRIETLEQRLSDAGL